MVKTHKLNINYKNNKTKKIYKGSGKHYRKKTRFASYEIISIYALIAEKLTANENIKKIRTLLNEKLGTKRTPFRNSVASNPDDECKVARKYAIINGGKNKCPCFQFIPAGERDNYNKEYKSIPLWNDGSLEGVTNMLEYDYNHQRREVGTEEGTYKERPKTIKGTYIGNKISKKKNDKRYRWGWVSAGPCWLCGQDVYINIDGENKTQCGECEHIGAITASLLAGMLKSQNFPWMILNYGTSHVHCNQRKSDDITMNFVYNQTEGTGEWKYDEETTKGIIKNIFNSRIHYTEYDYYFKKFHKDYENMSGANKRKIINDIKKTTETWCNTANEVMNTENIRGFQNEYNTWLASKNYPTRKESHKSIKQKAIRFASNIEYLMKQAIKKPHNTRSNGGAITTSGYGFPLPESNEDMFDLSGDYIYEFFAENLKNATNKLESDLLYIIENDEENDEDDDEDDGPPPGTPGTQETPRTPGTQETPRTPGTPITQTITRQTNTPISAIQGTQLFYSPGVGVNIDNDNESTTNDENRINVFGLPVVPDLRRVDSDSMVSFNDRNNNISNTDALQNIRNNSMERINSQGSVIRNNDINNNINTPQPQRSIESGTTPSLRRSIRLLSSTNNTPVSSEKRSKNGGKKTRKIRTR